MSCKVPGSALEHRWISDNCRAMKGDAAALDEAIASLRAKAEATLAKWPADRGMRLHLIATVERAT